MSDVKENVDSNGAEVVVAGGVYPDQPVTEGALESDAPTAGGADDVIFAKNAEAFGLDVDEARNLAKYDTDLAERLKKPRGDIDDSDSGEEPADDGTLDSDDSAATSDDADSSEEDDGQNEQSDTDKPADDNSGAEGDVAFADDVIPGLQGTDFAKLPPKAREAVASHFAAVNEKVAEAEARLAELNKLLDDPFVKQRKAVVEEGVPVRVRTMTAAERENMADLIANEVGLDKSEALQAMTTIQTRLNKIIEDAGQDFALRQADILERQRREQETIKQADEVMMSLQELNPNFAVKEKDIGKFFTYKDGKAVFNEAHPEIEKFKNGIGKVFEHAKKRGFDHHRIVEIGKTELYAMAAAANGWPVALNTEQRDKAIAVNAKKSALDAFLKPKGGGTLNVTGGSAAVRQASDDKVVIDGIDVVRLVGDRDYRLELMNKNPFDLDWSDKISKLLERGRAEIKKRKQ